METFYGLIFQALSLGIISGILLNIIAHPRDIQTGVEIWNLLDVPEIAAGETITLWGDYTYKGRKFRLIML
jgi:hypothetical protein